MPISTKKNIFEAVIICVLALAFGFLPQPAQSYALVAAMLYIPLIRRQRTYSFRPLSTTELRKWILVGCLFLGLFSIVVPVFAIHQMQRQLLWPSMLSVAGYMLQTTLAAAIPEEWFFRGFLMQRWQKQQPVTRAWWIPSQTNIMVSLVFALVHAMVERNPARLIVFFPSLWYGASVEQGAGLTYAMTLHALSNVVMFYWFTAFAL